MQVTRQALWQTTRWRRDLPVQAGVSRTASALARAGFNLALHVDDDPAEVRRNRARLATESGISGTWMWLDQRHGAEVVVDSEYSADYAADAVISRDPEKVAVVMTADCVPVLLSAANGAEVAAVHAGWPGLLQEILACAILRMDTPASSLFAWIGPCIRQNRYEVDEALQRRFVVLHPAYRAFFAAGRDGYFFADLAAIARHQLVARGVSRAHIADCGLCTSGDRGFFSYRRDGPRAGRIASFIRPARG